MVSVALAGCEHVSEVLVHTGQHYDANMSDVFFEQMGIRKPDYQLGIGGGSHGRMTGRQLEEIENVLLEERPDWMLVYGDTNSTLAGALAAVKLHVPVAHVEAGLRSFNRKMPEEINRVLTDHASDLLFVPTDTGVHNLAAEGIAAEKVHLVGDVMYDAALNYKKLACKPDWFDGVGAEDQRYVLCTVHRAENTDDLSRLRSIMDGLQASGLDVVLPLHPRTRAALEAADVRMPDNVHVAPPVDYLEMIWLEAHCRVIATDSGGVQKEAYFHDKPCVTLRDETEWLELVEHGCNVLVGADAGAIAHALQVAAFSASAPQLYGAGAASARIVQALR